MSSFNALHVKTCLWVWSNLLREEQSYIVGHYNFLMMLGTIKPFESHMILLTHIEPSIPNPKVFSRILAKTERGAIKWEK